MMRKTALAALLTLIVLLSSCTQQTVQASANDPSAAPAPAPPEPYVFPAQSTIRVRIDQSLSTKRNRPGDHFHASLAEPVLVDGQEVISRGTPVDGEVIRSKPSGRFKGRAVLGIRINSVEYRGQVVPIATYLDTRISRGHKKRNFVLIGGGAATGATIGAVAGGGVGAAVGAGVGASAGTVGAIITGKRQVYIPAEMVFTFRLKSDLDLAR